ncbi:hypothetical protein LQV05_002376 [Cryptococcus neoformans]|nr:hypothetical protein LQV05_002376 [Cryptococcus neoformans]
MHLQKEFQAGDGEFRAAKFFPRFQGPYQVQEANPTLSVYRLHMNDRTYPKFHGHLLKPYLSSPRFHQTSPITQHSDAERRRILQILDDRVYRGHRQLRVVLSGDGPNGQWRNLDDLHIYDGFQTLYEEYMGDDELAFAYTPSIDLDGIPLGPTLLDEKPLDSLAPVHDRPGESYRKTPGPTPAAVPDIAELKSLMAGLLRSSQAIVDQSVTTTNRLNDVSQSLPSRNSRPDRILPPRLSSSTSADAFALQHHILALDTYFQDVLLLWSPGDAESAWKVSVANSSISQAGSRFTTWLELYGKRAGSWDEWKTLLKTHLLTRGWEQKLRHKFMLLRCLDTTPTAFDTFFHLLISHQTLLRDFEDPLGDVDVCRRMLDGVDGLVTHRTKAVLKTKGQTVLTVTPANLHIIMIDLIDDAMLEARFLQNSTRTRPPLNNNRHATPHSPTPVIAQVQVVPQAPKGYTPQQLEWPLAPSSGALTRVSPARRPATTGSSARPAPPSSPPQHSSSAPAANLISLADDDSPDAPSIFSVDPIADQLVQDGATALAGSGPLLMVTCRVQANNGPATTLVDSGAGINVIDRGYAAQLGLRGTPVPPVGTKMADNRAGPVIEQEYLVDVSIGDTTYVATPFYAMPLGPKYRLILGLPFCRQHRLFDGATRLNKLLLDGGSSYASLANLQLNAITPCETPPVSSHRNLLSAAILRDFADILPANISDVSHYPPICSSMSQVRHHINILPNTAPVAKAGFRVPLAWRETLRQEIEKHRAAGRLRPSSSPWAAPAFLIRKDNGKFRFLCDFRGLNSVTVKDRTPVPIIDDILQRAAHGRVFAKLDLTDAFTLMHEPDIEKTAICTPWGLYEWVVMPQGACNSPATQQRRLNEALRNLISVCCEAYVDDIIIWGESDSDLATNIRAVLTALRKGGFVCSPSKSQFFVDSVTFLGHVISPNHIGPDPKKVEALRAWPSPSSVKDLRSFLGLLQYLRKFIPQIATKTAILTALLPPNKSAEKAYELRKHQLAKGSPVERLEALSWIWNWTTSAQRAFEDLKDMLARITGLSPLSHDAVLAGQINLYLFTDASNTGIGAWLGTGPSPDQAQPIAYDSRSLTSAERNYLVHEKELCAIIHALKEWHPLLLGLPVHVMTDHATLKWFFQQPNLSERQRRWLLILADYDLHISHIPGVTNVIADAFSRLHQDAPSINALTMMVLTPNADFVDQVANGYAQDPIMAVWQEGDQRPPGVQREEVQGMSGLQTVLQYEGRLCIPDVSGLWEQCLRECHDAMGHFGVEKTLELARCKYFWDGMV